MGDNFKFKHTEEHISVATPAEIPVRLSAVQFVNSKKDAFWPLLTGKGVKVCLIDSGNVEHRSIRASSQVANLGKSKHTKDVDGHAHAVAGIIGAADLHMLVGLAPDAIISYAKVTDDSGIATASAIAAGILWAIVVGMDVIVLSHVIDFDAKPLQMVLEKAASCQAVIIAESSEGSIPDFVLHVPDFSLHYPKDIYTLSPNDTYTLVDAAHFAPAILAGIVATLMEKGHTIPEGKVRGQVVKEHLRSLIAS